MLTKETNTFIITLINNNYFYVEIKNDVEFEVEDLKTLVSFQKELGGEKIFPVLINPSSRLCALLREAGHLSSVAQLLNWDQETYMPHNAAPARAEQLAAMSALVHERRTSKQVGELIAAEEADNGLDDAARANVREMRRDYDLATKLPTDLVAEIARTASMSQEVWKEARQKSDFAMFAPWLEKMMALSRRKAEHYGVARGG